MPPRERKRNAAAQKNMERLQARRGDEVGYQESNGNSKIYLVLNFVKRFCFSLLKPDRIWVLIFLPSFIRYMHLLRSSLKPRPLTIGSVVDHGGLENLISEYVKIEVVAEGLEGVLGAPLWRHDPDLGRGYLLFSQIELNRLWRWEEGGGAFTIGRSLFLEHAGCHDRVLKELGKGHSCDSLPLSGVRAMALDTRSDDLVHPIYLCEGGHQRVTRLEPNGTRVSIVSEVASGEDTSCSMAMDKAGGIYHTVLDASGEEKLVYQSVKNAMEEVREQVVVADGLKHVTGLTISDKFLFVALKGPVHNAAHWKKYHLVNTNKAKGDGNSGGGGDASVLMSSLAQGEPGGMAVDNKGHLYSAMGQGGVVIFNNKGDHIGTIFTGGLIATDVVLGDDGVLYITTHGCVLRVQTKSKPVSM